MQGWQNLVLSAMGVVVLAGLVAGALLMNRTDHMSRELIDDIQPARVAAYQLQAALRDQETAVRGYVIAGDKQFLDPYYAGQLVEKQAADDIRQRVGTRPDLMTDLDAIEQAAATWRTTYAEPLIADVSRWSARTRPARVTSGTREDRIRPPACTFRSPERQSGRRADGRNSRARPDAALA